ncbi:hypothetical protein GH975_00075 [Litorivicinus lipolyticus]|uniref:Uncharacterized protein n=1 Tax=Litorivicinus lipolyticus TaxID=418701 RepID=A0A5Q2QDE3_9GAMM|nr:hypothetical protein [Litorivicinus lipolyticus]QGG79035.1 hypothetical protein GH975_00075 [Litorivicinus lipolyticus]
MPVKTEPLCEQLRAIADLALDYACTGLAPEHYQPVIQRFHAAVHALPLCTQLVRILRDIHSLGLEDDLTTLIERSVLADAAARPDLPLSQIRVLFDCADWESLKVMARNPTLDDFTRHRARQLADHIMRAHLSGA